MDCLPLLKYLYPPRQSDTDSKDAKKKLKKTVRTIGATFGYRGIERLLLYLGRRIHERKMTYKYLRNQVLNATYSGSSHI